MTEKSMKQTECQENMQDLERVLKKQFWRTLMIIMTGVAGLFGWYHTEQKDWIGRIASASIKEDERIETESEKADARLERRIEYQETNQREIEKNQVRLEATLEANMKELRTILSRIEANQAKLEAAKK